MKRSLTILTFLAALPSGAALAGDDCAVPLADWQPRSAVVRLAEENGWVVRRIKIDDCCYEIKGTDREGRRIEVTFADDEVLLGSTLGYRPDGVGFFVTPADTRGNNVRVFVVSGAIRHVRFL